MATTPSSWYRSLLLLVLGAGFLIDHGNAQAPAIDSSWASAYTKATALVSQMTLEEMNNLTYGFGGSACSGASGSVPRLGFPGLCLQDAGNGVRGVDGVSAFASGVHVGASWNAELAYKRGVYMGAEFRAKGVDVALGPVVGPLGRTAKGGRNWEGFGADPYLDGALVGPTVQGMQQSVIACTKHYILYEQETNRLTLFTNPTAATYSANVDDQTIHEVYLWPFQEAVNAGTGSVMCSYNRINSTYGCQDDRTLNGLLKNETDFRGFVVSDWFAQQSGLPSALAGLDMAMPSSPLWDNNQLAALVRNGSLSKTRLMDMATRIVAAWYQANENAASDPPLGVGMVTNLTQAHALANVRDPESSPTILQGAYEGHVLVKNVNNALPLKQPKVLSLFGYDALPESIFTSYVATSQLGGTDLFQLNDIVLQTGNNFFNGFFAGVPQALTSNGTLITGGGSGSNTPPYTSTPFDAFTQRAIQDGTQLFWDFSRQDPSVEGASDACLVFINAFASEGWDRSSLTDDYSDVLVQNVASQCSNTMVFIHNAGIRLVDAWIENPNVTAVMFAHLPGQDSGRALTALVYGDVSPSGRLPYTVGKSEEDYGELLEPCMANTSVNLDPQCNFTEGVNIDYRSFLARNVTPRFEFGYGLTYTSFTYSPFSVSSVRCAGAGLFDTVATVSGSIRNTGNVEGAEVAQLYLQLPGASTQALRGFQKPVVQPGQTATVEFALRKKDVSTWDVRSQAWVQPSGKYMVFVGKSVLDVQWQGSFTL